MSKLPSLKKNNEFHRVYQKGRYAASGSLVIYVLKNRTGAPRFGITTSKKVGNSVQRNRMRRLIRENIRHLVNRLTSGLDVVFVARKADRVSTYDTIGKEMRYLLRKLDILDRDKDA